MDVRLVPIGHVCAKQQHDAIKGEEDAAEHVCGPISMSRQL